MDRPKRSTTKSTDFAKLNDPFKEQLKQMEQQDKSNYKTQMKLWNQQMAPLREEASKELSKLTGNTTELNLQTEKRTKKVEATIVTSSNQLKGLLEAQYKRNQSTNDETNLYLILQNKDKKESFGNPFVINRPKNSTFDGVIRPLEPVKDKKNTYTQPGSGGSYQDLAERMDSTTQNLKKRKKMSEDESIHEVNNDIIRSMKVQQLGQEYSAEDRQNISEFSLVQRFEQVRSRKSAIMKQKSDRDGSGGLSHIAKTLKMRKKFSQRYGGDSPEFKGVEKAENLRQLDNTGYSSDDDLKAKPYKKSKKE